MTAWHNARWLLIATLLLVVFAALGCDGGSDGAAPDPDAVRPSITGLSRGSANIGDTVEVYGMEFGDTQQGGSVRLNGVDFTVNSWSESLLNVTVAPGMSSGIVVVTVGSLSSISGPEAQLFIPAAPGGRPLISALVPDYAYTGNEILITGSNFGDDPTMGNVFFPAQPLTGAVSQADGVVVAEVVTIDVNGTPVPQWGPAGIKVLVPEGAASGNVYVEVNGERSNEKPFTWLGVPVLGDPVIFSVSPTNGEAGAAITLTGENFGHSQSGSTAELAGMSLNVVSWSDTTIEAIIPEGAVSGAIRVTVGGKPSNEVMFVVANKPLIMGVSPSRIRVGEPLTVFGKYFGYEQGSGNLKVGTATQPAASWNDELIEVTALTPISASGSQIPVVVKNDHGLESDPFMVSREPTLTVKVTVDPSAGQRNDQSGQGGTPFTFRVTVGGGSGSYTHYLIPNAARPSQMAPASTSNEIQYTYPFDPTADDYETYLTQMKVVDNSNSDEITVDGPSVLVVNPCVPVITRLEVSDFNRGGINAPNDWCWLASDGSYHDFSFLGADKYFTSSLSDVLVGGNPLASFTRDLEKFMTGSMSPRPYAYRYHDGSGGSEVLVRGLNFGDVQGQLWLNAGQAGNEYEITSFTGWSDTEITFDMPEEQRRLSGVVRVQPAGSEKQADSVQQLVTSIYATSVLPGVPVTLADGVVTLTGFDFEPPVLAGITGTGTYTIWVVRAQYDNPWGTGSVTGNALLVHPVAPTELVGTTMTVTLADLDPDGNGVVDVEVFNATGDDSRLVQGTLLAGPDADNPEYYYFFVWSGVLGEGAYEDIANSGIFSSAFQVGIIGGAGPGNDPPIADLDASPSSGTAPLDVTLDASGSTDPDGTIVLYEFDEGDGSWNDNGANPIYHVTFDADGNYTVRVRVTDDEGATDTASDTVQVGGGGGGNTVTVKVTITWAGAVTESSGDITVWIYEGDPDAGGTPWADGMGGPPISVAEAPLGEQHQNSYTDCPDHPGPLYIRIFKAQTDWDGDTVMDHFWKAGPFSLPPDAEFVFEGMQMEDPIGG